MGQPAFWRLLVSNNAVERCHSPIACRNAVRTVYRACEPELVGPEPGDLAPGRSAREECAGNVGKPRCTYCGVNERHRASTTALIHRPNRTSVWVNPPRIAFFIDGKCSRGNDEARIKIRLLPGCVPRCPYGGTSQASDLARLICLHRFKRGVHLTFSEFENAKPAKDFSRRA